MRALKIAGAAIAAVIAVIALLLVIGIPSGLPDLGNPGAGRARDRLSADHRWRHQDRHLAVAQRDAERHHAAGPEGPRHQQSPDRRPASQADITLASLWSGQPRSPNSSSTARCLNLPLLRERAARRRRRGSSRRRRTAGAATIDHVTVTDGTVVFSNLRDRVESRIDGINADAAIGGDRKIKSPAARAPASSR